MVLRVLALSLVMFGSTAGQDKPAADWGQGPARFEFWGEVNPSRARVTIERWLRSRVCLGAEVSVLSDSLSPNRYDVRARAAGVNTVPVERSFSIDVVRHPSDSLPLASKVLLSNNPETIKEDGILFHRRVEASAFRLMWHHRNDPKGPTRYVVVRILNPTSKRRLMRMYWNSQEPTGDAGSAGHKAALQYVTASRQQVSERLELEPYSEMTMDVRFLKAGQSSSGMAYFYDESNSSEPIHIALLAAPQGEAPADRNVGKSSRGRASGVFPGNISGDDVHVLGGPYTYIEYGGEPFVRDSDTGNPSRGNFGAVYRTRLVLFNPDRLEGEVVLGFMAAGGAAAGVLRINSQIHDLPLMNAGNTFEICRIEVPPTGVKQLDLEFLPEAGSNYPVRIVVSSEYQGRKKVNLKPPLSFKAVVR